MNDDPLKLTRVERWILSNQYKILEQIFPNEADYYREARKAIESGYELEYERLAERIYADKHGLTTEECREVLEILAMFQMLKDVTGTGEGIPGVEPWQVQFAGFDGNTEMSRMAYVHYFYSVHGGRSTELERGDDFNSHTPLSLDRYRRQLAEWRASKTTYSLTADDVKRIASAAIHPEHRGKG
jgi:uncharacterized protein YfbU (UPF0304 family)